VIDVVLPALDEAPAISRVLDSFPGGFRPIVVDNGSADATASIAVASGAFVITEPQRGFGAACFAGLRAATADVVCFMDCDGSLDPADLARVAAPVVDGSADLVLGARRPVSRHAWPLHARAANRVLAARASRRVGTRLRDLGPMRAARRGALLGLQLRDRRFGWPLEMVLRAGEQAWTIVEVPVEYRPRIGTSKVTGTVAGTLRTIRDMSVALAR
jgi:glycosyltransferase involved in cell wall biosynthesis